MTPVVSFVHATTYEITPTSLRFPPYLWSAFIGLNKLHSIWRWYRRIELYRNSNNISQLFVGHLINFVVGESRLIRIAAQCLLIATRLLECVQEQSAVWRAWGRLVLTIKGRRLCSTVAWERRKVMLLSPSSLYSWKVRLHIVVDRVQQVFWKVFSLIKHILQLSMKVMDVVDAIYWDESTRYDAIPESFVNMTKWLETIMENKEVLLSGLEENNELIKKILHRSPLSYEQLHDGIAAVLEKTEKIHNQVKKLSKIGNGILIEAGKKAWEGAKIVVGV